MNPPPLPEAKIFFGGAIEARCNCAIQVNISTAGGFFTRPLQVNG